MQSPKTYSLADLEGALCVCNNAIVQTRRGNGGPVLKLDELKNDAEALRVLVAKAIAEPNQLLSFHQIGEALPRLTYWHQRDTKSPLTRPEIIKAKGGVG